MSARRLQPAGQEGIALVLTLLVMAVASAVLVSVVQYTGSSGRDARGNHARQSAYGLAEAGINYALSVLANASNPTSSTLLPSTTVTLPSGTTTYSGVLSGQVWTLTAVGTVANPAGPTSSSIRRTVSRVVSMNSTSVGSFSGLWDRIYSDATGTCSVTVNPGMSIPSKFAAKGDVCMANASITGATTTVDIGGKLTITNSATSGAGVPSAASGWTSPTNVFASDNAYATATVAATLDSATLNATGFGFAIPLTATINGITVTVERKSSVSNTLKDGSVYMLKSGSPVGTNHAGTSFWATSDSTITYGSTSDLWGTTWTPAEVNASTFGLRFIGHNYHASSSSTASVDAITISVTYTNSGLGVGSSSTSIARASIAVSCTLNTNPAHNPCSSADNVWAGSYANPPQNLTRPTINWDYWYANAKPGPKQPCTTSSGSPPAFDSNTTYDGSNGEKEITPEGQSYTCRVTDAGGNIIGELSWNHTSRVLTIAGTIFFDGDAVFHDHDVAAWHYRGRGVIYIAKDWHNDERVCAGSATSDCRTTGMPTWDTNTDLMVLVVGGKNGAGDDDFDFHRDAAFQGAIYAAHTCKIKDTAMVQGPLNCGALDFDDDAPTFYAWPPLPNSAVGQIYTTGTDSDIHLVLGAQTG